MFFVLLGRLFVFVCLTCFVYLSLFTSWFTIKLIFAQYACTCYFALAHAPDTLSIHFVATSIDATQVVSSLLFASFTTSGCFSLLVLCLASCWPLDLMPAAGSLRLVELKVDPIPLGPIKRAASAQGPA